MLHLIIEPGRYGGHFDLILATCEPRPDVPLSGIRIAMFSCPMAAGRNCLQIADMLRESGAAVTIHQPEGETK